MRVTSKANIYFVDLVDIGVMTAEYHVELSISTYRKSEDKFGCQVRSFMTDNVANMAEMHKDIGKRDEKF